MTRKYVVLASFLIFAASMGGVVGIVFQRKEACTIQSNVLDNKGQSLKTDSSTRATTCYWFGFGCAYRCEKWCTQELNRVMIGAELTPLAARIDYSCGARAGHAFGALKQDTLTHGSLTVK
jgi:hypothetical protein